jgi:hypothetical protein
LYKKYKDRVEFFVVYIREAHPSDGWATKGNERMGIAIPDPKNWAERADIARTACVKLDISMPCIVDELDDAVNKAYAAWPDRLYVVDKDGRIAVKGGPGPRGFAPSVLEAERWLAKLDGHTK